MSGMQAFRKERSKGQWMLVYVLFAGVLWFSLPVIRDLWRGPRNADRPLSPRPALQNVLPSSVVVTSADSDFDPVVELDQEPPMVVRSVPPLLTHPLVTKSKFDQIRSGMSLREVQDVIGADGVMMAESELLGTRHEMWSWQNDNGSNMNVQFMDGKAHTKAQLGLR
jgi:hypothetical protein